jgi:hypothetical protein
MTSHRYATPEAFKQALEQRLRSSSRSGADMAHRRQLLVFDRFLARVVQTIGDAVLLKGGLVLERRLDRARATKDVDLSFKGSPERLLERLQQAAELNLGDFLTYDVNPDPAHPRIQNDGMPYDGLRFRARTTLAGKLYGQAFGIDVAFADPILGDPEEIVPEDLLGFAGIPPPVLRVYPIETHIAEKLHAYTMPRNRVNSRVKDLPDLGILARIRPIDAARLREALEQSFTYRKSHAVPTAFPDPPPSWTAAYQKMAQDDELPWATLSELLAAVRAFLDPLLAGTATGKWSPSTWSWDSSREEPS